MTTPDLSAIDQAASALADAEYQRGVTAGTAAQLNSDRGALDALTAQLQAAQAALATAIAANRPATSMQFGWNVSVNAEPGEGIGKRYTEVIAQCGLPGLGARTKFFGGASGNWQTALANLVAMGWGKRPGEVEPVLCAKVHTAASFNALMDTLTATVWCVYFQEPEDDIAAGSTAVSVASYRAAYQSMDALRKKHPNGHFVKLLANLMEYQEVDVHNSTRDWKALCTGLTLDAIGGDVYDDNWRPTVGWTPASQLSWLVDASKTLGVPWCVPEFAIAVSTKSPGDTEVARAQRIQAAVDYMKANGCLWANWWQDNSQCWLDPVTPGFAAWRALTS